MDFSHIHTTTFLCTGKNILVASAAVITEQTAGAVGCILYCLMRLLVCHLNIFMLPTALPCHPSLKGFVWKIKWLKFEVNYMLFSGGKKVHDSH